MATATAARPGRYTLHYPRAWDPAPILSKLSHPGMRSSEWRRAACRMNPLLFALVYMQDTLRSPETGDRISLSEFHIDLAESAKRWARMDVGPGEIRDAWVAPRGAGKSSWVFLVLPLWSMAYGWRKFIIAFADSYATQARQHMTTFKLQLATNELLKTDFPELCAPARRDGHSAMNAQDAYLAENGAALVVRGMDSSSLGAKIGNRRPDLILLDDVEPAAAKYSADQKAKRMDAMRNAIFPMNYKAIVQLAGTTVMHGSIVHDIVRRTPWVLEDGITCRHYPAIMTDPVTGEERSLWPQMWPLDYLRSRRVTASGKLNAEYALNMDNCPVLDSAPEGGAAAATLDGAYWTEDDFVLDTSGHLGASVERKVLCIDPAVTSKKGADATGLAVVGRTSSGKCLVERAIGVWQPPREVRGIVHRMVAYDPLIRQVVVEINNGGEYILDVLGDLPNGVKLTPSRAVESKNSRITKLYYHYQAGRVVHSKVHPDLHRQMCAWPHPPHDDIIDSVEAGVRHFLGAA